MWVKVLVLVIKSWETPGLLKRKSALNGLLKSSDEEALEMEWSEFNISWQMPLEIYIYLSR